MIKKFNEFINENYNGDNYIIRIDTPVTPSNINQVQTEMNSAFGKDNILPLDVDDDEHWYYTVKADEKTVANFGAEYISAMDCNTEDPESVYDAFYNKYEA